MPPTIRQLKKDRRSKARKQADFLTAFMDLVSVTRAAKKAKIHRTTVYDWIKEENKEFSNAFDQACEVATAKLEDEAVRRAYEGTVKPVFQGGKQVGKIREYSDTLLIVLLKARSPKKYIERVAAVHSGDKDNPIYQKLEIVNITSSTPVAENEEDVV